jgi:PAS fold/BON domain
MSKYDDASLREQDRFIHQIAELTPVVLTVFDLATQHDIYISPDVVSMHGYTPDDLARVKDLFSDLLHPEDALRVREHFARLKRAEGGEIEVLPLSPEDDRLRLALYRSIYDWDSPLFRYATQSVPPIHIIVNHGRAILKGVVATKADSDLAYIRARGVPGLFDVKNELQAESERPR